MSVERICKNCKLYDKQESVCTVTVIHEGNYYELPVLPGNRCFWEQEDIEIQQLRAWSDGRDGFIEATTPS